MQVATLDPFRGYANAIDDELADATARSAFSAASLREGNRIAHRVLDSFHTCPIPEIARIGRTLRTWRKQLLAYFTSGRANNGGTEAIMNRPEFAGGLVG